MRCSQRVRRATAKSIFITLFVMIAIDTFPLGITGDAGPFSFIYYLKSAIRPVLRPFGLWQSEWRLFAPDPVISNCWWTIEARVFEARGDLVAELRTNLESSGPAPSEPSNEQPNLITWNSPYWGEVRPVDKFFKRRHIAYSRRLSQFPVTVLEDYADEWVRKRFGDRLRPLGDLPLTSNLLDPGASQPDVKADIESLPYSLELTIYRNELKLAATDDGTLPKREDTTWLSVTEKYLQRRYSQ